MPEAAKPGLRERKKARTRATIRNEAMRLFREQGYAETTVEQIAAAADVSPSTFFRYFPSKEQVVLTDDLDPIMIAAALAQPADVPPLRAFRQAIEAVYGSLSKEDREFERSRQRLILSVPELRATIMLELARSIDLLAGALAERTGRTAEDFEVRVLAGAVAGAAIAVMEDLDDFGVISRAIKFLEDGMPL